MATTNEAIAQGVRLSTQMHRTYSGAMEAIVKQPMGTMLTTNVSNSWTPNDFRNRWNSFSSILGGGHAVWNDNIDLHETGLTPLMISLNASSDM